MATATLSQSRGGRAVAGADSCEQQAGTVTAARDWGGPAENRHVTLALAGSREEFFHRMEAPNLSAAPARKGNGSLPRPSHRGSNRPGGWA